MPQRVEAAAGVPRELKRIQGLCLIVVATPEHLLIWNELMLREHPLHDARLVGRQFRYLISSDHGWLGGIGFGSAALYLEGRDTYLGWNDAQRRAQLSRVINMTRFLNNENAGLNVASLLQTHRTQTLRRMKAHPLMLVVQDTSDLNFSSRPHCTGLGEITANQTGAKTRSLKLHTALAVEPESGLPLGLLRLHGHAPESAQGNPPPSPHRAKGFQPLARMLSGGQCHRRPAARHPDHQRGRPGGRHVRAV